MSLTAETIARWSSNSLEAMTYSIQSSRERMRHLQRAIEQSERERSHALCAELHVHDEVQGLELQALRRCVCVF